eukprot:4320065-Pyramimonas_sp.AAC.1
MKGQTFINSSTASDLHLMRCDLRSMHTSSSNARSLRKIRVGEGVRSYEWLISQIEAMMLRDKDEWNISMHEGTLNQRARQRDWAVAEATAMITAEVPTAKPLRQE